VLDHLTALSQLVTGTSRASTAQLNALGGRVDRLVADLDVLQLRVLKSLGSFDEVQLRIQKQLADRPPLTDREIGRIARAVTQGLLDQVRVEVERDPR